jgi:Uma2 family endonuclease
MSPKSEEHDDSADPWLEQLIFYRAARRDVVQKVVPEAWVRIGPKDFRIGDIGVYLVGPRSAQKRPARAPELMIEILSPGTASADSDYIEKRADYHAIGVQEYLIVDRPGRRVVAMIHEPTGYAERILTEVDTYTTPLLPGMAIPLAEVFAEG